MVTLNYAAFMILKKKKSCKTVYTEVFVCVNFHSFWLDFLKYIIRVYLAFSSNIFFFTFFFPG